VVSRPMFNVNRGAVFISLPPPVERFVGDGSLCWSGTCATGVAVGRVPCLSSILLHLLAFDMPHLRWNSFPMTKRELEDTKTGNHHYAKAVRLPNIPNGGMSVTILLEMLVVRRVDEGLFEGFKTR